MPRDAPLTPICAPADAETGCLPRGYRLREFIIERVLAEGGFGVVYVAIDPRLQRRVAIKEYMPAALARRAGDFSVLPRSSAPLQDAFAIGLRSFINEARMLAGFDHPALVRVLQFWEDKGTGFMVMPLYQAPTVRQWTLARVDAPEPAWLLGFVEQMLEALELVHGVACLHRDIAPDNILLQRDRDPLLLDFGAARRVIEQMTQTLTAIVKPGFAPIEQYGHSEGLRQGPWTDLYALCATVHFMLTRRAPPPAVGRMVADEYTPLAQSLQGRYPAALLAAIDAGLAVRPAERPQSVAQMRNLLRAGAAGAVTVSSCNQRPAASAPEPSPIERVGSAPALEIGAEVRPVDALARTGQPANASALADLLWRRPLSPRTALVAVTVAAIASSAWFATGAGAPASIDTAATAAAVAAPVPQPITRPQPAAEPVPTADTPDAVPQLASTAVSIEPPAAMPPAPAALALPTPSAQRMAELARLRESAARREPMTPRTPAVRTAPATIERSVEPKAAAASTPAAGPATTELPGLPAATADAPAPVRPAALQPLDQPRPQFPAEAVRAGIDQGRVVARLHVADDGRVGNVDIVESVPRRTFDRAVLAAAAQWRYAPPGQPRAVVIEFVFRRDS